MERERDSTRAKTRMRIGICLLLSIAIGCATYTLGAIVWACADPQGAGKALLFTIPIAFAGTAIPGLLALLGLVFRCDWATPRAAARKPLRPAAVRPPRKRVASRPME